MRKTTIITNTLVAIFFIFCGWYLKGRFTPPAMPMGGMSGGPVTVLTETVVLSSQRPQKEYIGIVDPIKSVDLRPQISGYVEKVLFKEGSLVKEGDLLFLIEQQRYLANLELMEAELNKAKANLVKVEKEYNRQSSLNKQQFASDSALETATSNFAEAKALVKQAQANLDLAKIDIEYTEIKAPISGIIGKAFVTKGNYIQAGGESLAKIVQQKPIRVAFSVSDKDYLNAERDGIEHKEARVILANGDVLKDKASRIFADNEIDTTTATIGIYAEYDNKDNVLVSGNYVKVFISDSALSQHIIIPSEAILQDKNGNYVLTVNEENVVEHRRIKVGLPFDDKQEVLEGLNVGDKIIIQGLQKAKEGATVNPQEVK
ncbi:MAG: efflux RND transporter periplasmic adaptor subunit [Alphaproteobacteria bacterium]